MVILRVNICSRWMVISHVVEESKTAYVAIAEQVHRPSSHSGRIQIEPRLFCS